MAEKRRFVMLMVVDDEEGCMAAREALAEEGRRYDFEIDLRDFVDGVGLLEYLDQRKREDGPKGPAPDLILLDLNTAALGGKETVQEMKTHPACRRIPIIVFTRLADHADVIECYHCGGSAFRQKTYDAKVIREMVHIVVHNWLCAGQSPGGWRFECMGYG